MSGRGVPWEGGCALCGALIGIGRTLTTLEATLIVHAIGAPLIFGGLALVYFRRFRYTTPLQIAIIFVVVVMLRDGTLVADLLERSYAMFASVLGTWISLR